VGAVIQNCERFYLTAKRCRPHMYFICLE
jgi:hypothetical protein